MADKMAEEAIKEQAKEDKEIEKAMKRVEPGNAGITPSEEIKVEINES